VRRVAAVVLALVIVTALGLWAPPPAVRGQAVDVYINVTGGDRSRKLNIAVPEFTVVAGTDTALAKLLASVVGNDLTLSGLFSVVAASGAIPANNPAALGQTWSAFAAAGAHAGVHGLLGIRGERLEAEMRLYDLTTPEYRLIASRKFEAAAPQSRRLAHKIADEIVLQFTGEPGIADTKMAYVVGPAGAKELAVADYDGLEAGVLEVVAHQPRDLRLVLDHQDLLHRPPPILQEPDETAGRRQASAPPPWPAPSHAGRLASAARLLGGLVPRLVAGLVVLAAVPVLEPLWAALPPRARRAPAVATGAVATGAAPTAAPERAAHQQDDPDHQQREQDEPEREEAIPVAVPVTEPWTDHPHHLGVLAALAQALGDALGDAGVVGGDPDPDPCQDREQHHPDHHGPSHLVLLQTGRFAYTADAAGVM